LEEKGGLGCAGTHFLADSPPVHGRLLLQCCRLAGVPLPQRRRHRRAAAQQRTAQHLGQLCPHGHRLLHGRVGGGDRAAVCLAALVHPSSCFRLLADPLLHACMPSAAAVAAAAALLLDARQQGAPPLAAPVLVLAARLAQCRLSLAQPPALPRPRLLLRLAHALVCRSCVGQRPGHA